MSFLDKLINHFCYEPPTQEQQALLDELELSKARVLCIAKGNSLKEKLTEHLAITELVKIMENNPKVFSDATEITEEELAEIKMAIYNHNSLGKILSTIKRNGCLVAGDIRLEYVESANGVPCLITTKR